MSDSLHVHSSRMRGHKIQGHRTKERREDKKEKEKEYKVPRRINGHNILTEPKWQDKKRRKGKGIRYAKGKEKNDIIFVCKFHVYHIYEAENKSETMYPSSRSILDISITTYRILMEAI